MIKTFYRAPFDSFSYQIWQEFTNQLTVDFESYYEHITAAQGAIPYLCKKNRFSKSLIVLAIKDYWLKRGSRVNNDADVYFIDCVRQNPNKTFVLLHSLENLHKVFDEPNLHMICWGGDITNQIYRYQALESALDKDLDNAVNFIALNRNLRNHRVASVSLLHALELQQYGKVTFLGHSGLMPATIDKIWPNPPAVFEQGYSMVRPMHTLVTESPEIYPYENCDNIRNFETKLRQYYRRALVEIVSETCFDQTCFNITEKTLHTFLTGMIPIWLSSAGTVQFLRDVGFDVYDDFVDHSYDLETDNYQRVYRAIVDNIELLRNFECVQSFWLANQHRIKHNEHRVRTIDQWYLSRAKLKFAKILPKINGV